MKRTTRQLTLVTLVAAAITMLPQSSAGQTSQERAVRAASDAWQRYISAQSVDSIVALHTADAVVMFANNPVMTGSSSIRALWSDIVKIPGLSMQWTPTNIEVVSPTVAIERGNYSESYDTPAGKANDAGSYVTIWRKVNGKWRVSLDAPVSTVPQPAATATEATDFVVRSGSALSWSDFAPPGFPAGGKISVLFGNPAAAGPFAFRLQFPDGFQVPLHWHPRPENVTVLSGTVQFGMGNTLDMTKTQSYGAGDFVFIPARHAHYLQARGATVLQVSGIGPFQVNLGAPK